MLLLRVLVPARMDRSWGGGRFKEVRGANGEWKKEKRGVSRGYLTLAEIKKKKEKKIKIAGYDAEKGDFRDKN